jgi:hypothetical protein
MTKRPMETTFGTWGIAVRYVQRRIERLLVVTNYGLHQNRDAVLYEVLDTP